MASIAQYTRLVRFGKNFLWLLAIAIIMMVVWIASRNNANNGGRMVFTNIPVAPDSENVMKKPRYHGIDVHGRPYTIEADTATQKDKETVALKNVNADLTSDNGAWIALKAGSGLLNTTSKQMVLLNDVEVFYEGGYQFHTNRAYIDTAKGTVQGDSHIEGQGPVGTVEAESFSVLERGNIIRFNDSVRMLLY